MYSIPENLNATEFSGWINQDLLLKDSRRSATSRKRSYELTNVVIEDQCDDLHRRVLRPRNNPELPSSPGASRTRPIRSNRARRRLSLTPDVILQPPPTEVFVAETPLSTSASHLSIIQALLSYNWPQNYLVAHSDPSIHQMVEPSTYSHLNVHRIEPRLPAFDPWVLHNYMLASSGYATITGGHRLQDSSHDEQNRNTSQLGYHSMVSENAMTHNLIWQYPFLLSPSLHHLQNQITRPPELGLTTSNNNADSHSDLSYLYRPANISQRDATSNSSETNLRTDRIHAGMYQSEHSISNFNNHILPNPFNYGSLCPYHNTSHIVQNNQHTSHTMANTSSNLSEQQQQQSSSFNNFANQSEMTFGNYWHQMNPVIRPVNYPINSSNIDTLLHLAAHFEQRKRGITREELDKLPTHRHKTVSEKAKRIKLCTDKSKVEDKVDSQKCLVCLEDFESKQSIRTLRCKHEFHAKCIDKWLKINRTCPLCRADSFDGSAQKDGS